MNIAVSDRERKRRRKHFHQFELNFYSNIDLIAQPVKFERRGGKTNGFSSVIESITNNSCLSL